MSKPVIETIDLWHVYEGNVTALRGINLRIYPGEFVAIIGQNGSGKTTLVKHFNGLLKPTKGQVLIEGEDIRNLKVSEVARKVGFVFQNPDHQIFASTVEEEIAFGLRNIGLPPEQIKDRVDEALKFLNMEEARKKFPRSLGLGEKQKLAVASVIAMKPKIIILDEPTTGHDYAESVEVMERVKELNEKEGVTIIFISHNMDIVAQYAKRTIVMCHGQILLDDDTRSVFSKPEILKTAYIRPPQIPYLAYMLGIESHNLPLSVDEMYDLLMNYLAKSKGS